MLSDTVISIAFTGRVGEFDILDENTSTQGVAYDYRSVMHPTVVAFAKYRHKSIVLLNFTGPFYGPKYPTSLDIFHVNIMYCKGNEYATKYTSNKKVIEKTG